jgi:hypothetical protein
MGPARSIGAIATMITLVVSLGACSSDDGDAPPASDPAASVVADVTGATVAPTSEPVSDGVSEPSETVPSAGNFSIDGPASVDPDFGGANPGGDEAGG